jgi:hypothetical protein
LILLPLQQSREYMEDLLENFVELCHLYNYNDFYNPRTVYNFKFIEHTYSGDHSTYNEYLAEYLLNFSFFKRLSYDTINKYLQSEDMSFLTVNQGDILSTSHDDDSLEAPVHVILNGKIIMYEHTVEKPETQNVVAILTEGKIVGVRSLD